VYYALTYLWGQSSPELPLSALDVKLINLPIGVLVGVLSRRREVERMKKVFQGIPYSINIINH